MCMCVCVRAFIGFYKRTRIYICALSLRDFRILFRRSVFMRATAPFPSKFVTMNMIYGI